jgi:hypothetical protein
MKLVNLEIIGPEGNPITIRVNPDSVCLLTEAGVPGNITGPDGNKTLKPGCIVDFGVKAVMIGLPIDEVQKKLEQE